LWQLARPAGMSDIAAVRATARATPTMHNVPEATLFAIESQAESQRHSAGYGGAEAGRPGADDAPTTRTRTTAYIAGRAKGCGSLPCYT
jgi:hypothetical protein